MNTQKPQKSDKPENPPKPRTQLNLRFLAGLLAVFAVLGIGVHFVHGFQVKRSAVGLLQQADRAKDAGNAAKEIDSLGRYLRMVPDDWDAMARFAERLDDVAKATEPRGAARVPAYFYFEEVLRHNSDRHDIRRRQVETALALGRFGDAESHLDKLLARPELSNARLDKVLEQREVTDPQDKDALRERGDLERLKGLAEEGRKQYTKARSAYENSMKYAKDQLDSYVLAAALYHDRLDKPEVAYSTLDRMVNLSSQQREAHRFRAVQLLKFAAKTPLSSKAEALVAEDVRVSLKQSPKDPDVILLAAAFARVNSSVKDKPQEVRKILTEGIQHKLGDHRLYVELISLEVAENQLDAARKYIDKGLQELPNNNDLRYALAEMQVLKNELKEAEANAKRLREAKFDQSGRRKTTPRLDYLEARIRIRRGEWSAAGQMLQTLRPDLAARAPETEVPVWLLIGQCHEKLGNPEQALAAYRRAQKLDPLSVTARYGAGMMLLFLGSLDEASAEFQHLLNRSKPPRGLHLQLARALILLNMQLPLNKRDVTTINERLDLVEKETPDSPELPLLRAQALLLRGNDNQTDAAQRVVAEQLKVHPENASLWVALAQFEGRSGSVAAALKVLDKAEAEHPKLRDNVEMLLARLSYLTMIAPTKATEGPAEREKEKADYEKRLAVARQEVDKIEKNMPNLEKADRLRLLNGLADAHIRLGDDKDTERLWKEIAAQEKNNLNIRLLLFDRALIVGEEAEAANRLAEIKRIEGPQGPFGNYGEAGRLVEGVLREMKEQGELTQANRDKLERARVYLQEAAQQRTRWARIPALEAEIHQLEGDKPKAIEKYQLALELGERRPVVIRQLVRLLFEERKFKEANEVVHKFLNQESTLVLAGLGKLAAEALLTSQDPATRDADHIEKLAENAVKGSQSYHDFLWLGRVRWALDKRAEAREALETALKKGENAPETWVTLVAFLVDINQKKEAEEITQRAAAKLPEESRTLALAACYEALGELKKTEHFLKQSLEAKPGDPLVLHNVANFYLHHDRPKDAEPLLQALLQTKGIKLDEKLWARRNLAVVMTSDWSLKGFEKAKELLAQNLKEGLKEGNEERLVDKHAMALLLATRRNERKTAIPMLEELSRRGPLTAPERFGLVQLYLTDDNWERAREHMLILLASPEGANPAYRADYARNLLRRGAIDDAKAQLRILERTHPNDPVTQEIKARLYKAQGKHAEAIAAVHDFASSKKLDLGQTALVIEALGQPSGKDAKNPEAKQAEALYRNEADRMLRAYVAAEPQKPERALALAAFLGRQKAVTEALDNCFNVTEKKTKVSADAVAAVMIDVLRRGDAGKQQSQRVEQWLKKELEKAPKSILLMVYLADLYDYQEEFSKAEDLYFRAMRENSESVIVLNNLAWLLAFKEDSRANALKLINNAIDLDGPSAELLDTRAVIYLNMKNSGAALKDLQAAIDQSPSASRYFHLAQALTMGKKYGEAYKILVDKAENEYDLKEKQLHSYERPTYRTMRVELEALKNR